MAFRDPEEQKEYSRRYYQENKEKYRRRKKARNEAIRANPERLAAEREKQRQYASANRERVREASRRYRERHLERRRKAGRSLCPFRKALHKSRSEAKRCGHLPCMATVDEIKAAYTGQCQVSGCHRSEAASGRRLCLEHCRKTGRFRGWVCTPCNVSLGLMNDSTGRLQALAAYLARTSVQSETPPPADETRRD